MNDDAHTDAAAAEPSLEGETPRTPVLPLAGFLPVLQWGLRENLRARRTLIMLAVAVGLGALSALMVTQAGGPFRRADPAFRLWRMLDWQVLQILLPLIALLLVGPAYSRELRQRTMVYHLVRPVARSTVFLARFVAGVVPAFLAAVLLLASAVFFSGVDVPSAVWMGLPVTALFGVLVLGAVYYFLAAVFKRGLIAGLIYTFMIEMVVSNLPGAIQKLSIRFHLRSLHHGLVDDSFASISTRVDRVLTEGSAVTMTERVRHAVLGTIEYDTPAAAVLILLSITAALLLVGIAIVRRRDFALKD